MHYRMPELNFDCKFFVLTDYAIQNSLTIPMSKKILRKAGILNHHNVLPVKQWSRWIHAL
jgi:hypothetical protein